MRVKLLLVLFLANLLVFFFIYRMERPHRSAVDTIAGENLFGPKVMLTDRIEISGTALAQKRTLERRGAAWHITTPFEWPANYYAVNRILSQLQFLEKEVAFSLEEVRKTGQSIADYGLDNPNLTLALHHAGSVTTLDIGDPTPLGNQRYALSPDRTRILVLSEELIEGLSIDLTDLRSQYILSIPLYEVRSFAVQVEDLKIRLIREGQQWHFEAPIQTDADPEEVSVSLNRLIATQVSDFLGPAEADAAAATLENPAMRITLEGNNRRQTLLLSAPVPAPDNSESSEVRYARLDETPTVFTVHAAPFDLLIKAQESLREKNFVHFDREALNAIEITGKSGPSLTLRKLETGEWQVRVPDPNVTTPAQPADESILQGLIDGLRDLRAVAFTSDAPSESDLERFGFTNPQRTIILKGVGEDSTVVCIGHSNPESGLLYTKMGPPEVPSYIYEVSPHILELLPLSALHYHTRVLNLQPSTAKIESLKLTDLKEGVVLLEHTIDPQTEEWESLLATIESKNAVLTLLDSCRSLKVQDYIEGGFSDTFEPASGPQEPWVYRLDATFYLNGGGANIPYETVTLFFTRRLAGNLQVAGSPDLDEIFTLPQSLIDALSDLTVPVPERSIGLSENRDGL